MSMEEFRDQANDAVAVFGESFRLCERHLAAVRPPP